MIHDNILSLIGNTPIVSLDRLSAELGVRVCAKLENLNPGGSHKARIAHAMVLDAERRGILVRGSGQTILEPSGGNTGIGLCMAAIRYGYQVVLVIPDNYSKEKQRLLTLYGADIVLSDSRRGNNSHGEKALELQLENPGWVMLNQQRNAANPEIHRQTTAREILADFGDVPIDYFVTGIGTGGHITGIGSVLKQHLPNLLVVGVEPEGCDIRASRHRSHQIQGLSIGLVPDVLDMSIVDDMVQVSEDACVTMVRYIMRHEALSLGISSAASLVAIRQLRERGMLADDATVLTMVYDSVDSYLNYFDPVWQPTLSEEVSVESV